jgi:hypothetical protein
LHKTVSNSSLQAINDMAATNGIHLRRTLYLTILSAAGYEEAGHNGSSSSTRVF